MQVNKTLKKKKTLFRCETRQIQRKMTSRAPPLVLTVFHNGAVH